MQRQLHNIMSKDISLNENEFAGGKINRKVLMVKMSPAINNTNFLSAMFLRNFAVTSAITQNNSHVKNESTPPISTIITYISIAESKNDRCCLKQEAMMV